MHVKRLLIVIGLLLSLAPLLAQQRFVSPVLGGPTLIGYVISLNLNSVADTTLTPTGAATKYIVRRVVVTNASVNLTGSAARLALYTGAGATGTQITTISNIDTLTSATTFADLPVAILAAGGLSGSTLTATPIYVRVTAVHGSAATIDVYVYGEILP